MGNFVSVQGFAVDPFAQAFPESYDGAFSVECPASHKGKSFEGGDVGVDVPTSHGELHELVVCILFLGGVCPGIVKRHFEFCPKYFVILAYMVWSGDVCACY